MHRPTMRYRASPRIGRRIAAAALLALALGACNRIAPTDAAADKPGSGALHADGAWVRATPPNAPVAGGYLTLRNDGASDDRLVSMSSPDAQRVEIHEMRMDGGTMTMRQLDDGVAVPAGAAVALKPGGIHLMFIGPTHPYVAGGQVSATLVYAKAAPQTLVLPVQPLGATAAPGTAGGAPSDGSGGDRH